MIADHRIASSTTELSTLVAYGGQQFAIPVLTNDGFEVYAKPRARRWPIPYHDTVWDYSALQDLNPPHSIGMCEEATKLAVNKYISPGRILDMPISMDGVDEYRIPIQLKPLENLIQRIVDYEHEINPDAANYFAYLTLDQSIVRPYQTQRKGGAHVDGFQGARIKNKVKIGHSYIFCNENPTAFFLQGFDVEGLDPAKDNFFHAFDRQAKLENRVTFDPYEIVLFNAYSVHEAVANPLIPIFRTFFRLSFSKRIFDRLGNAHNPLFDYKWKMVARNVASVLE